MAHLPGQAYRKVTGIHEGSFDGARPGMDAVCSGWDDDDAICASFCPLLFLNRKSATPLRSVGHTGAIADEDGLMG